MKQFLEMLDNLPTWLKVLFAVFIDIIWCAYRICRAVDEGDTTALVIAVVFLFLPFVALLDVVFILWKGQVWCYHSAQTIR